MRKTLPLFVVALVTAIELPAREIVPVEAGRAAAAWVRRDNAPLGAALGSSAVADVRSVEGANGEPIFHVVRLEGGGTVVTSVESGIVPVVAFLDGVAEADGNPLWDILAADMSNRLARVAAARAEGGTRSVASASGGSRLMLKAVDNGAPVESDLPIVAAEAAWAELLAEDENSATKGGARLKASSIAAASGLSDLRVAPLISTTWEQGGNAANYYTPPNTAGDPDNYVCGCVALAGAEIADFWRFPTQSRPQVTNLCYLSGVATNFVSLGGTYDWQNMSADFSSLSVAQKQAVGRLCYDFGVATKMNWCPLPEGSGTLGVLLGEAFCDVFGYANAMAYYHYEGNVMPDALVERAVLANLDAQSPVAISLAGHTAVADGYGYASGTLYTHINLGWGGIGNAWYNLPEVEVNEGGSSYSSSILDGVVYNIHPTATGELLTGRILDGKGDPVAGATVTAQGGGVTVSATTDAHGIYALRVTGGRTWDLSATHGLLRGSVSAYVGLSSSTVCTERTSTGGRITRGEIGNSWGNDITISFVTGDLYVDALNGSDGNDGRSWATAKASIQAAIDIVEAGFATNAVVLVADGRYEPIVATNNIPFGIYSVNGPEVTFIDGLLQWARGVTNRCATLGSSNSHTNTIVSGFTLTNGVARYGGGSYYGKLENCRLAGNTATSMGGGSYGAALEDCVVSGNSANNGGGLYMGLASRCTISGNTANSMGGGANSVPLTRCVVTNNTAGSYGGGVAYRTLTFCTVVSNIAGQSGGGSYGAALVNCVVVYNEAESQYGGGAYSGALTNCTVFANSASSGGGVKDSSLVNCIVWGNEAQTYANVYVPATKPCLYSCLGEALPGDEHVGNIVADPLFVDGVYGDYHLQANSPCIDAGANELVVGETDFYGDARISGGRVDMGASEFQSTPSAGYAAWAAENNLGAADAVTEGVPNLVRYVFGRPRGVFSPFTGLTFQDGNPVVWFQSFNPDVSGVSLSLLSTTNLLDWTHPVEFSLPGPPFSFNGMILQHSDTAPARFYKLKVR